MSLLMKIETRSLQIQIHVNDMFLFFQYTYWLIIHSDNILFLNLLISMKHCFEYLNASTTKKADSFLFFRENRKIIVIIFLIKETNFNLFFNLYSFTKWFDSAFRMLDIVQRWLTSTIIDFIKMVAVMTKNVSLGIHLFQLQPKKRWKTPLSTSWTYIITKRTRNLYWDGQQLSFFINIQML